jgi:Flp pilus assembly pilin Flp
MVNRSRVTTVRQDPCAMLVFELLAGKVSHVYESKIPSENRLRFPRLTDESGQAMTEYILVVGIAVVGLILVLQALTLSVLEYYEMQAIWISLPIM